MPTGTTRSPVACRCRRADRRARHRARRDARPARRRPDRSGPRVRPRTRRNGRLSSSSWASTRSTGAARRSADRRCRRSSRSAARAPALISIAVYAASSYGEDLSGERAVARADLGDAERGRRAERVGERREGACEEHAERRMHVRARHEVAVGAHRRVVVEPARPVERELHERRERDRVRRRGCAFGSRRPGRSHGRSMASTCEDERRGRATDPSRRVGGLRARRRRPASPRCSSFGAARRAGSCPATSRSPAARSMPTTRRTPSDGSAIRAHAARAAAVRELVEEAGITLTADGLVASDGFGADRRGAAVARAAVGALPLGGAARGAGPLRRPLLHRGGRRRRRDDARRRRGDRPVVDDAAPAARGVAGRGAQALLADLVHGDGARGVHDRSPRCARSGSRPATPRPTRRRPMPRHVMEQE